MLIWFSPSAEFKVSFNWFLDKFATVEYLDEISWSLLTIVQTLVSSLICLMPVIQYHDQPRRMNACILILYFNTIPLIKDKLQYLFGLKDKPILLVIVADENNIYFISIESPEIKDEPSAYGVNLLCESNMLYIPVFNIALTNGSVHLYFLIYNSIVSYYGMSVSMFYNIRRWTMIAYTEPV